MKDGLKLDARLRNKRGGPVHFSGKSTRPEDHSVGDQDVGISKILKKDWSEEEKPEKPKQR